jgi:hypothetical protein
VGGCEHSLTSNKNKHTYRIISITFGSTKNLKVMFVPVVEGLCSEHFFSSHTVGGTYFDQNHTRGGIRGPLWLRKQVAPGDYFGSFICQIFE